MKKILVTGGLGYIGSHVVVELQISGFEVIIIDDLSNSSLDVLDNIFDITGKNVYNEIFNSHGFQAKLISLPNLNNGIYVVTLSSKGSVFQKKLVVR